MNNQNYRKNTPGSVFMTLMILFVLSFFFYNLSKNGLNGNRRLEIRYSDFVTLLEDGLVSEVSWGENELTFYMTDEYPENAATEKFDYDELKRAENSGSSLTTVPVPEDSENLLEIMLSKNVKVLKEKPDNTSYIFETVLSFLIPILVMIVFMVIMTRRMNGGNGMMNIGKSTAKIYMETNTGKTFSDVAGEEEAKESLREIVDFLHEPHKYKEIGARLPKGALLVGPPGTGKTLLAKAVAGEAGVPFYSLSGSDFVEMFVGVGASRVRDLFRQASQHCPCIIFIDEIDAIGKKRDGRLGSSGNDEREQTLNQLLSEMDGFDPLMGIMVMGATNRPEVLDQALLRPGRFDRRIIVEKPDLQGRIDILKVHSKDVKLEENIDFKEIALLSTGAVGADLSNMVNEAAINAVREGHERVSQKDLISAVETVLVGKEKKTRILKGEEKRLVSYHEVGHALVNAIKKDAEPVQKITIIPRTMGVLGYVMQVPEEEKFLSTENELKTMITGLLGGRAAEEIVFGYTTTGASNDIEKATKIARNMITRYGMNKKFGLMCLESPESQYIEGRNISDCADITAASIDEEIRKMLSESYEEAKKILTENRESLDRIADYLLKEESISGHVFMSLLRNEKEDS